MLGDSGHLVDFGVGLVLAHAARHHPVAVDRAPQIGLALSTRCNSV